MGNPKCTLPEAEREQVFRWFDGQRTQEQEDRVGEIQELLAAHGARKVMMDYTENGKVEAVTFGLMLNGTLAGFRIDARPAGVTAVMKKDGVKCDAAQAERIAWRNVKDWIAAQIALVETEQATMEQVFLPYLLDREKTLYQKMMESGYAPPLLRGDM